MATNVIGTVSTSSPGPTPAAISARCSADVPVFTRDAMLDPVSSGERLLERGDLGAEDVAAALRDRGQRLKNLISDLGELRLEVHEWDARVLGRCGRARVPGRLIGPAPDRWTTGCGGGGIGLGSRRRPFPARRRR